MNIVENFKSFKKNKYCSNEINSASLKEDVWL